MIPKINTLGFVVSKNLIEPDLHKIDMLLKASTPHDKTSLWAFLSLLQYFRKMLVHLLHVCHSLYQLTSPNTTFEWLDIHNAAFLAAKDMISKNILNTRFDPSKRTKVYFDASKFAVCGILTQDSAVVHCASKTLNNAQKKLPTIERELFAFTFSCKKFRIQLHGHHFEVFTDHQPLVGLTKKLDNIDNHGNALQCYAYFYITVLIHNVISSWKEKYFGGLRHKTNSRNRLGMSLGRSS